MMSIYFSDSVLGIQRTRSSKYLTADLLCYASVFSTTEFSLWTAQRSVDIEKSVFDICMYPMFMMNMQLQQRV